MEARPDIHGCVFTAVPGIVLPVRIAAGGFDHQPRIAVNRGGRRRRDRAALTTEPRILYSGPTYPVVIQLK